MTILQRNDSVEAATDQLLIDSLLTSDGSGGRLKALSLKELLRRVRAGAELTYTNLGVCGPENLPL